MVLAPVSSRIPCLPQPHNTLERSLLLTTEEIKGNLKAVRVQKRSKESPSKSERYKKNAEAQENHKRNMLWGITRKRVRDKSGKDKETEMDLKSHEPYL